MENKAFITGLIFLFAACQGEQQVSSRVDTLPFYNEATFTPHWFESEEMVPKDFHKIPPFTLTNQLGESFSQDDVAGKIYITDFFFTTCPGICLDMTRNMAIVQDSFKNDGSVILVSHSVTPASDSVSVLRRYAKSKGVIDGKWHLLTGAQSEIYDLGRNQYFVEEDLGLLKKATDFIHTENFVLVDGKSRIRGIYNGLNKTAIQQLIADVKTLKNSSTF
jgi:protein SCO1/2